MSKIGEYSTSAAYWDGKLPIVYQSEDMQSANGTVEGHVFVAPCDLEIVEVGYRVLTAATNAAAELNIGVKGALTGILDAHTLTNVAAGFRTVPISALTTANVSKGAALVMSVVNADSTGLHAGYIVAMPRT